MSEAYKKKILTHFPSIKAIDKIALKKYLIFIL